MTMLIASAAFLLGGIATLLGVAKLVFQPELGSRELANSGAVRHLPAA